MGKKIKQKVSIKNEDDFDNDSLSDGGNDDGFAVMENEFYPDEED